MLQRVRIYLIFIAFGVSYLLINSINQYTNNIHCLQSSESPKIIKNLKYDEKAEETWLQPEPTIRYNGSFNMEKLLNKTRRKIRYELRNYNFSGNAKLENFIMESGGQPLRSLIISTWRSGSTFLGDLINSIPSNFYHYEPFSYYKIMQIRGPPVSNKAAKTIKNIFRCSYAEMEDYFNYGRSYLHQFKHNKRLWDHCKNNNDLCFGANFTERMCKLFPFHSMKVVRFRLRLVNEILDDKQLSNHINAIFRN